MGSFSMDDLLETGLEYIALLSQQRWVMLLAFSAALGGAAGFLAGFLGVGGGIVLVPGLYYGLDALGYPADDLMHIAVGTSLAVIVPTGLSSARSHWRRGAVRFDLVRLMGAGIVPGVAAGTILAALMSGNLLKMVFAMILLLLAVVMALPPKQIASLPAAAGGGGDSDDFKMPPRRAFCAGGVIGTVSSLMGIGGATMSVPFLTLSHVPLHKAIGTAAALGPVIATPAALGFMVIGWGTETSVPGLAGYVNIPAWLMIVPFSILAAPGGARAAHFMPVRPLRFSFAVFLCLVALRMLYGFFYGT